MPKVFWGASLNHSVSNRGRRLPAIFLFVVMAAGVGMHSTRAQQTANPPPATPTANSANPGDSTNPPKTPTIRATVELVNVPISATNKRGQRVIDLTLDDLKVFEDGVEQKITHFERETRTPLRIGLIIDSSNSARPKLSYEKDAAQQFCDMILSNSSSKTEMFLETFDASSSIVQDFTHDSDLLVEKIEGLQSGGGKALYDAIYLACREKMFNAGPPEEVRRVLVVVSDGLDVQSQHTLDETISMARTSETMIYTVGTAAYGYANPGDKTLEELSTQTGGSAFFPLRNPPGTDEEAGYLSHGQIGDTSQNKSLGAESGSLSSERLSNLVIALQVIGRDLSEQYWISYRPLRAAMDGTYRTIKVETTRRGVNLRWKPGYFAGTE